MELIIAIQRPLLDIRAWVREIEQGIQEQPKPDDIGKETGKNQQVPPNTVRAIVSFDDETIRAAKSEDNPKESTQKSIRKAAWFAFGAATIYAAIAAFQYCEMRKATKAATEAAKIASEELELSQRPWVSLENFTVESPLVFDSNGARVTVGYQIKNTGRSPAIRGFWQPDFFLQFGDTPSPVKKRDDACKFAGIRSTKVTDARLTESWFPGDGIPRKIVVGVSADDIAEALKLPSQMFPGGTHMKEFDYIYPDFVVCVAYRASFTDAQYHTGYILQLGRSNAEKLSIPPMKSGEIPASELKLYTHPFYGIYAD